MEVSASNREGVKRPNTLLTYICLISQPQLPAMMCSIKDNRYERQKYFLTRSGIQRVIYVLEGDMDAVQVPPPLPHPTHPTFFISPLHYL